MGKWDKYLISQTPPNVAHPETRNRESDFPWINHPICIDNEVNGTVPGAFYVEPNMVVRTSKGSPEDQRPHKHDFGEYLVFLSTSQDELINLGGEVEFWLGGEKHVITQSTAVFVPRGVFHGPLFVRRVDRPFVFIVVADTLKYSRSGYDDDFTYGEGTGHKYDINFVSDSPPNRLHPQSREQQSEFTFVNYSISIDDGGHGKLPDAFWLEPNMVLRAADQRKMSRPHIHLFDEYLLFFSLNPDDLTNLGGETDVLFEGETHTITKTTAFFLPRGMYHAALGTSHVDRPFGAMGIANTPKYAHFAYSDAPEHADGMMLDEIVEVTLGGKQYKFTKTYAEYLDWLIERYRKVHL